ncbi:MAG TPA: hypothetical protein VMB74_01905 [Streptosporangiaceae bacterium]|nr:hypothetical protein [Streptosporangiaceae bacterium]
MGALLVVHAGSHNTLPVFTTYAADVAFGPSGFAGFTTGTGSASWVGLARSFYGLFWILVFLAIANSTLANSNAGVNVSSRTAFAMGRIRAFPSLFGPVSPRHRAPVNAIVLGTVISLAGAGIKIAGVSWISPLPAPLSYMGPAVAIGVIYLVYLYLRDPQRVVDVGLIHLGETPAEAAAVQRGPAWVSRPAR